MEINKLDKLAINAIDNHAKAATDQFIFNHPPEKCGVHYKKTHCKNEYYTYETAKSENELNNQSLSRRAHAIMFEMTSTKTEEEIEISAMRHSKLLELVSVVGYLKELKAKARYIELAETCISEMQLLSLKDLRHDYVDRLHDISSRWKQGKEAYHAELKKIWG